MDTEQERITKKTIGVIFGGISGEHEVSLVSAESIISVMKNRGYNIVPIGISRDGKWLISGDPLETLRFNKNIPQDELVFLSTDPSVKGLVVLKRDDSGDYKFDRTVQIDIIFPVLHGTYGEDGVIQGLFELSGLPYIGCGVTACACGMDKIVMKRLFSSAGLNVVKDIYFHRASWQKDKDSIISKCEDLGYPLFVKPANTGSSVGISKANNRSKLEKAIEKACEYDIKIQVETSVEKAREIEVAVLGNYEPIASIPGEIIPSNEFYDYEAKYESGQSKTLIPANINEKLQEEIRLKAKIAYNAIGCEGLARVDFLLDPKTEELFINEVNTLPGFTSISMYSALWGATGIPYEELIDRLIYLALERFAERKKNSVKGGNKTSWFKG